MAVNTTKRTRQQRRAAAGKDQAAARRRRYQARIDAAPTPSGRLAEALDYVRTGLARVRDPQRAERLVEPAIALLVDVGDQLSQEPEQEVATRGRA